MKQPQCGHELLPARITGGRAAIGGHITCSLAAAALLVYTITMESSRCIQATAPWCQPFQVWERLTHFLCRLLCEGVLQICWWNTHRSQRISTIQSSPHCIKNGSASVHNPTQAAAITIRTDIIGGATSNTPEPRPPL